LGSTFSTWSNCDCFRLGCYVSSSVLYGTKDAGAQIAMPILAIIAKCLVTPLRFMANYSSHVASPFDDGGKSSFAAKQTGL
jgi:hypothetical protein